MAGSDSNTSASICSNYDEIKKPRYYTILYNACTLRILLAIYGHIGLFATRLSSKALKRKTNITLTV